MWVKDKLIKIVMSSTSKTRQPLFEMGVERAIPSVVPRNSCRSLEFNSPTLGSLSSGFSTYLTRRVKRTHVICLS